MKNLLVLVMALFFILIIFFAFSCGDDDEENSSNDEDENFLGACCDMNNQCRPVESKDCTNPGDLWRGTGLECYPDPCSNESSSDPGACCVADDQCITAIHEECSTINGRFLGSAISCTPNPCDTGDDDDDDDCDGNTAPTLEGTVWVVNDAMENYPAGAYATTGDIIGVGFIWADAECNLIDGYGTVTITINGVEEAPLEIGPFEDYIGCSTNQSQMLIGFFYDEPLPAGIYDWIFTATDICDAESQEQTGTFTIVE